MAGDFFRGVHYTRVSDHAVEACLLSHRLATSSSRDELMPDKHVVVIWDASRLSAEEKRQTKVLDAFLRACGPPWWCCQLHPGTGRNCAT